MRLISLELKHVTADDDDDDDEDYDWQKYSEKFEMISMRKSFGRHEDY